VWAHGSKAWLLLNRGGFLMDGWRVTATNPASDSPTVRTDSLRFFFGDMTLTAIKPDIAATMLPQASWCLVAITFDDKGVPLRKSIAMIRATFESVRCNQNFICL
jgi:hypothetical protein